MSLQITTIELGVGTIRVDEHKFDKKNKKKNRINLTKNNWPT
jgi:hypothetical protein